MSKDNPLENYDAAAKEFIGVDIEDFAAGAVASIKEHLERAARSGVQIDDVLRRDWTELAIETAAGEVTLTPADSLSDEVLRAQITSSEDPSFQPGEVIAVEGISTGGAYLLPGVLAPGARMAYRRRVIIHYRAGDKNDHTELVLTPEQIDEYTKGDSPAFVKTEDGMDLTFFSPTPLVSDFVAHAVLTETESGKERSRYLF